MIEMVFNKRDKDVWYGGGPNPAITRVCKTYFHDECGLFLDGGYDGKNDGLVKFGVDYNGVYHMYMFEIIGGTRWREKADALKQWFTDRKYKVTEHHTWTWKNSVMHVGVKLWVYAK